MPRCASCNNMRHPQDFDESGMCAYCRASTEYAEALKALREHEWELNDNQTRMLCNTCGAKSKPSTIAPKHKSNCAYYKLITAYADLAKH